MVKTKSKQELLDEIMKDILKQKICPDLAAGATQLVFGDGSPDAELVFIGEAPGKNEDKQGLPFVGAAGKFLNEMLAGIGLKREDVYITNIVKYRPPENRDPYPDEKAAFLPFLKRQLLVIKPKLIVTLGRHSMKTLLPGLKISQVHGQPKRIKVRMSASLDEMQGSGEERSKTYKKVRRTSTVADDTADRQELLPESAALAVEQGKSVLWVILPLFHPAAALYNGSMRQTLIDDFAKIPRILAQI